MQTSWSYHRPHRPYPPVRVQRATGTLHSIEQSKKHDRLPENCFPMMISLIFFSGRQLLWRQREGGPESEGLGLGLEADPSLPPAGLRPGVQLRWNAPANQVNGVTSGHGKGGGRIRHPRLLASGKGFALCKHLPSSHEHPGAGI